MIYADDSGGNPIIQSPSASSVVNTGTIQRPFIPDPTGGGGGSTDPVQFPIGRGFIPGGEIIGEGGPTTGGTVKKEPDGPITVIIGGSGGSSGTTTTPVADAKSSFSDAISALAGLFSFGAAPQQPQQPRTVAVPVQNTNSGGSSFGGVGMLLIVALLGGLAFLAYKKGWFGKAKKAVVSEAT